jgi:hypothetical protein
MDGIGAPLDEKRKQATEVVVQIESSPLEYMSVRTFAGAGSGTIESDMRGAEASCELVKIGWTSGPADEARFTKVFQAETVGHGELLGIGSDDFEIAARVKVRAGRFFNGQESVARAAAGMNAAELHADAGVLLDKGDTRVEVTAAEKDVVKHSRRSSGSPRGQRCGESGAGEGEKSSA